MSFSLNKQLEGTCLTIKVSGSVDEDAEFQPVSESGITAVMIDLEGVSSINSLGIREWIKWVKAIPPTLQLSVRRCPKVIVDQINMVSGFLPTTTVVESFFVPYFADATGSEKMILFEKGKEYGEGNIKFPEGLKDDSGEPMEIDVIEAKYFKFLLNG